MKTGKKIIILFLLIMTLCSCTQKESQTGTTDTAEITQTESEEDNMRLKIEANGKNLIANFEDNSSAEAFIQKLEEGPLTVELEDYANFEKVGELPFSLERNDTQITTQPGDVILYQGNMITIYYDTNSWNFTKLAKIPDVNKDDLLEVLGNGDVTVTFSLTE